MAKKNNGKWLLAGAALVLTYTAVTGKGPFNKRRFKKQHEELAKYVDANYPNCQYSPIEAHGRGYSAAILRAGRVVKFVYFTRDEEGNYIFTELDERIG